MQNNREIRYYVGDASDLEDLDYFEVEASTYTFAWEAEEVATELFDDVYPPVEVGDLTFEWRCFLANTICEIDMSDYDDTGSED